MIHLDDQLMNNSASIDCRVLCSSRTIQTTSRQHVSNSKPAVHYWARVTSRIALFTSWMNGTSGNRNCPIYTILTHFHFCSTCAFHKVHWFANDRSPKIKIVSTDRKQGEVVFIHQKIHWWLENLVLKDASWISYTDILKPIPSPNIRWFWQIYFPYRKFN